MNIVYQFTRWATRKQYMGKGSMTIVPWWAYLWGGILIVMTGLLAGTIVFVFLEMLPQGMDIQMPVFSIILPLSIIIPFTMVTMAIVLVKRGD